MRIKDNDSPGLHRIAVLGASVSAQTIDHQNGEPVGYVEVLRRQHLAELGASKITQFCYPGNRASDGALIKVRELVESDATICIFEPLIEELKRGVYATREEVLFIYRELLKARIFVVVYFCVHPSKQSPERFEQHDLHRDICNSLGIPIIEASMESVTDIQETYRGIHTRLPGARMYARQIVDAWKHIDFSAAGLERFFSALQLPDTPIRVESVQYPNTGDTSWMLIRGKRSQRGTARFRLRVIQPQQIGPFSPVLDVCLFTHDGAKWHKKCFENSIWDPYCHYERMSYVVLFDGWVDCHTFEIDIRKSGRDPAYDSVRHPVASWPDLSGRTMRPRGDIYVASDEFITLELIGNSTEEPIFPDVTPQLRTANDLMRLGEYSQAAKMYEQLLQDGYFSASLRVNLSLAQKRAAAQGRNASTTQSASVVNRYEASGGLKSPGRWINMTPDDWRSVSLRCQLGACLPVLSIVVPCFNSGRLLRETLVRMIATRSVPFEVVIVDDGSTDGSLELLEKFAGRYANIRVMGQAHKGAGAARNLAIAHCKGLYSFFLDADDEMDLSEVSKAVVHAIVNDRDLVFLPYCIYHNDSRAYQPMYAEDDACFKKAIHANDQQALQRLACELTGFPWNRIVATAMLQNEQILFCETKVHNDMLFHWQSIALSQKMDYWQNVVCIHKKFSSGSLSSSYGKRRLEVFDAMRVTYEKLKNNESFRRNRDVWDRICQKTLNWNREIISPDVTDAFDAGLQRFREDAVVQNWGANEKDEVASPASTVATSERDQTLQIPASVREDACADMQNLLPGLTQQMRDSIRELIFSDARDLPIERQLVRHIVASTNNRSEKKDVRLKKLIALLRYDMRVITQLF